MTNTGNDNSRASIAWMVDLVRTAVRLERWTSCIRECRLNCAPYEIAYDASIERWMMQEPKTSPDDKDDYLKMLLDKANRIESKVYGHQPIANHRIGNILMLALPLTVLNVCSILCHFLYFLDPKVLGRLTQCAIGLLRVNLFCGIYSQRLHANLATVAA